MKLIKNCFLFICTLLLLSHCTKPPEMFRDLKQQLTGYWKLVSYGGGFANLPDTKTQDDIIISFTAGGRYRVYANDTLQTNTKYHMVYDQSSSIKKKQALIALKGEKPYLNFTISGEKLRLSGNHPDATYFNYRKINK